MKDYDRFNIALTKSALEFFHGTPKPLMPLDEGVGQLRDMVAQHVAIKPPVFGTDRQL